MGERSNISKTVSPSHSKTLRYVKTSSPSFDRNLMKLLYFLPFFTRFITLFKNISLSSFFRIFSTLSPALISNRETAELFTYLMVLFSSNITIPSINLSKNGHIKTPFNLGNFTKSDVNGQKLC